MKKKLTSS